MVFLEFTNTCHTLIELQFKMYVIKRWLCYITKSGNNWKQGKCEKSISLIYPSSEGEGERERERKTFLLSNICCVLLLLIYLLYFIFILFFNFFSLYLYVYILQTLCFTCNLIFVWIKNKILQKTKTWDRIK